MEPLIIGIGLIILGIILYEGVLIARRGILAKSMSLRTVPFQQSPGAAKTHILILGDSMSFGVGAEHQSQSLAGRLGHDYPNAYIENASENGMTLKRLLKKVQRLPKKKKYDIVLVHIGGMDVISFTPQRTAAHCMEKILTHTVKLLKKNNTENVLLVSVNNAGSLPIFRFPFDILFEKRSRQFRDVFTMLSKKHHVTHISLFQERDVDQLAKNPQTLISRDGIHPNDAGYGIWYNMIKVHIAHII